MKDKLKSFIEVFLIFLFFIFSSYIVQENMDGVSSLIKGGLFGIFIYIVIVILAIVIAPISMVPIIPIASNVWGWRLSAILNITGWTFGSIIAFYLARKYGAPLINKFVSIKKLNKIESLMPKQNVFWGIVFLRMSLPVDILSYALGLFSKITLKRYVLATLIGVTPFAFVLAYVGTVSFYYQIGALIIGLFIFALGVLIALRMKKLVRRGIN